MHAALCDYVILNVYPKLAVAECIGAASVIPLTLRVYGRRWVMRRFGK